MKLKKQIVILLFVLPAMLTGCLFFGESEYVLKIDDVKIGINEYMVYLYEQEKLFESSGGQDIWETELDGTAARDYAKQNAVNTIKLVKVAVNKADELGIGITKEEEINAFKEGSKLYEEIKKNKPELNISEEEVSDITKEWYIQKSVFEYVTDGFEISDADFTAYFDDYYNKNKSELNDVDIKYIFIEGTNNKSYEKAYSVYEKILTGSDFDYILNKYSDGKNETVNLENGNFEPEVKQAGYDLTEEGQLSYIVKTASGYYILKSVKIETPDMDKLKEKFLNSYIQEKKQDIYQKQTAAWAQNVKVEKNDKVYNDIKVG